MDWPATVVDEPAPVAEQTFTASADPTWHAWNRWSPEVEWCDAVAALCAALAPMLTVETGVGQGFVTRRLMDVAASVSGRLVCYESDRPFAHAAAEAGAPVAADPSPDVDTLASAGLTVVDSLSPVRRREIGRWDEAGRPGTLVVHDVRPWETSGDHRGLWNLIAELGLSGILWGNPRGSAVACQRPGPLAVASTLLPVRRVFHP